jgi:hypothetical protein
MNQRFFKGDQNIAWDALPCAKALLMVSSSPTFFIQDEKLGTADARITHKDKFELTSDYCNRFTGAVWVHQDTSIGPFYALPTEPYTYKKFGFFLKHVDSTFEDIADEFGLWDFLPELGISKRKGQLIRSLTEGENYIGIVPTVDVQRSISSYKLIEGGLGNFYRFMLMLLYKGALKASSKNLWFNVKNRVRNLAESAKVFAKENPEATVSDLQVFIWKFGFKNIFETEAPKLTKASDVFCFDGEIPHTVFMTTLRHPQEFADSYNEALNKAHLPLKRLKMKDGLMELPFFLECDVSGELVRWHIKATFDKSITLRMYYKPEGSKVIQLPQNPTIEDVKRSISKEFGCHTLIGKAGTLISELTRPPRIIALPEQGSKYAPMVKFLTKELRNRGIDYNEGQLMRIGLNALDSLKILDNTEINLPGFLSCFWGKSKSSEWIASNWRKFASMSSELINAMNFSSGQLLTVAKYIIMEKESNLPDVLPPKFQKLGNVKGISAPVSQRLLEKLKSLVEKRDLILEQRRIMKAEFKNATMLFGIEKAIMLLVAGILKRHDQMASLFYINHRPYALSFYITFGPETVRDMAQNAQTRREEC